RAHDLTRYVALDDLQARLPGEPVVHRVLDAVVADAVAVQHIALRLELLRALAGDRPHVADDVRGERPGRVLTHGHPLDFHTGEPLLLGDQQAGDVVVDVGRDGHRAVRRDTLALSDHLSEALHGDAALVHGV